MFRSKQFHYGTDCGWIYGNYHNHYNGSFYHIISKMNPETLDFEEYHVDGSYICQEIGLIDKNGKHLYQNDKIVYISENDGTEWVTVVDSNMIKGLFTENIKLNIHLDMYRESIEDYNFEIIGTKWDDKDHKNRPMVQGVKEILTTEDMDNLPF